MYDDLHFPERVKVAKAHARWSRNLLMTKCFALVCAGIAALAYAI